MKRGWKTWLILSLGVAVVGAALYFPALRDRVKRAARLKQLTEEQARRELSQPVAGNEGEPRVKVKLFWASEKGDSALEGVSAELPLSSDPTLRAKQVLNTLLAGPVDSDLRTLPPDAALLAFYLLPDGTGVADFSEALATSLPSGIDSEEMAVDSIARTLEANMPQVRRLKILIHGQEAETLAGHVDLTGTFVVHANAVPIAPPSPPAAATAPSAAPAAATPANVTNRDAKSLTPVTGASKLAQPGHKP